MSWGVCPVDPATALPSLQLLEAALDELMVDITTGLPSDFRVSTIQHRKQDITEARECVDETVRLAADPLHAVLTYEDEVEDF
jgi:hypothetical protein